jgi:hypothetical protein
LSSITSSKTEKLNEIFTLTKQKLQPTLDALQDKKDELLSASKHLPDTSISPQSTSPGNTDVLFAAIKQKQYQQQTDSEPSKITSSFDTDQDKITDKKLQSDRSRFNEFQEEKLQEEVSKAVSQIMKQAAHIVHDKIQPPIDSMLTTKITEQDSSTQKKFVPFISDRSKQTTVNTSSPNQINQFSHEKTNSNKELKSTQVQQEFNNTSSVIHPSDNVMNNPKLLSNTSQEISNDQDYNAINTSIKPSPKSTLTTKLPIVTDISPMTNKSSESMKIEPFNKKKSLSTLCNLFVDF